MAAKGKTGYFCTECGYECAKWTGKCPSCGAWNTIQEAPVRAKEAVSRVRGASHLDADTPTPLPDVIREDFPRTSVGIAELDRVLGGGLVAGSVILIGGDPGIGKSTLLLQAAEKLAQQGKKVLYVSGEESLRQVAMRAARLRAKSPRLLLYAQTHLENILEEIEKTAPDAVIVDSIQTVASREADSSAGSVSQIRESAGAFVRAAKTLGCSVFLVGHVTKAGSLAGPRVLEHMVDTVLYFEGEEFQAYRVLRSVKNRFGPTHEVGLFEMTEDGMREVSNPSEMFLSEREREAPGSVVTAAMEGTRPVLVELQSLVSRTVFGMPRRQASGMDYNRLVLLLAVLEKRAGLALFDQDVYLNVAGGLKITEPAVDLGAAVAAASSFRGKVLPRGTVVFGEVSLTGEVRPVRFAEARVAEAVRAGFTRVILPKRNAKGLHAPKDIRIAGVSTVAEALVQLTEPTDGVPANE